eukprot:990218-Rhodomonas_salina.2
MEGAEEELSASWQGDAVRQVAKGVEMLVTALNTLWNTFVGPMLICRTFKCFAMVSIICWRCSSR